MLQGISILNSAEEEPAASALWPIGQASDARTCDSNGCPHGRHRHGDFNRRAIELKRKAIGYVCHDGLLVSYFWEIESGMTFYLLLSLQDRETYVFPSFILGALRQLSCVEFQISGNRQFIVKVES